MSEASVPFLEAALGLAAGGFAVFPIHGVRPDLSCTCSEADCSNPGKHPRTAHGFKDATSDPGQLRQWWAQWPDSNVGVATDGLFVLDCDPRHGGDGSLGALEAKYGSLPRTTAALTGGGGAHYYFRPRSGEEARCRTGLLPGIDVRGKGGYVVAPPSRHESGAGYSWMPGREIGHNELAEVPGWLADLAAAPRPSTISEAAGSGAGVGVHPLILTLNTEEVGGSDLMRRALAYAGRVPPAVKGERNSTVFSLAGHLAAIVDEHGACLSEISIVEVVATWNGRLSEPLSHDDPAQEFGQSS